MIDYKTFKARKSGPSWENSDVNFEYDDVIYNEVDDENYKIVWIDLTDKDHSNPDKYVLIKDIFEMSDEDFRKHYSPAAVAVKERYLDSYIIIYGEDVIMQLRKEAEAFKREIDKYAKIDFDKLGI